jgi:hypothetical protein
MKNTLKLIGAMRSIAIIALVAVIGASCSSAPPFITLDEPIKPDSKSAVVIFLQFGSTDAQIWDGEKPVGTFKNMPASSRYCMYWKTTPGAHNFVARSSNFVNKKMNLQANRTYYIRIHDLPSPPYTTLIAMEELSKKDYDDFMSKSNFLKTTNIEFDNKWRADFLAENDGKWLKELKEYLKTAK